MTKTTALRRQRRIPAARRAAFTAFYAAVRGQMRLKQGARGLDGKLVLITRG